MRRRIFYPLIVFGCLIFSAVLVSAADFVVENSWIREAPPGAKALAAYMTIENRSADAVALTGASSPNFRKVMIHQTKMESGIAKMKKQERLLIDANSRIVLEPGGYHLMLMDPARPLTAGDKATLQLHFDSGNTITVTTLVRKMKP